MIYFCCILHFILLLTTMDILHTVDSITDLKKARAVVKGQITKANRLVEDASGISKEVLQSRLDMLQEMWKRFEAIQLKIELIINEESIDDEISYRVDMEDKYYTIKDLLLIQHAQFEQEHHTNGRRNEQSSGH